VTKAEMRQINDPHPARKTTMKTLTLKNVPDDLAYTLSYIAKEKHQTIGDIAIQAIRQSLAVFQASKCNRDLTAFFGGWSKSDAEEFERNVSVFEQIDEELWKK